MFRQCVSAVQKCREREGELHFSGPKEADKAAGRREGRKQVSFCYGVEREEERERKKLLSYGGFSSSSSSSSLSFFSLHVVWLFLLACSLPSRSRGRTGRGRERKIKWLQRVFSLQAKKSGKRRRRNSRRRRAQQQQQLRDRLFRKRDLFLCRRRRRRGIFTSFKLTQTRSDLLRDALLMPTKERDIGKNSTKTHDLRKSRKK